MKTASLRRWLVPGLITTSIALLYLPFLAVPFEYDDKVEILANQVLREPGNITELLRYNPFRLLLLWSFAADLWAWGFRPQGYRAVNILIHLGNSLMLLAIMRLFAERWRLAEAGLFAAAGALLFAVHPLAIESVTYISGRSSSLATFFVLLSLLSYARYVELLERAQPAAAVLRSGAQSLARRIALVLGLSLSASLPVAWGVRHGDFTLRAAIPGLLAVIACIILLAAVLSRKNPETDKVPPQSHRTLSRRAAIFYCVALTAFLLGCLCKEIAAVTPALLLLAELQVWQKTWRGALQRLGDRLLPFVLVPALLIALRAVAYGYIASPEFLRPWHHNLITQFEVVARYLKLWLVPYPLSIYHEYPVVLPPGTLKTWLSAGLLATLLAAAMVWRRRQPALCFGLLAAALCLAPTSSLFALKETMAEHRTYLPSLGYAFVAGALLAGPVSRKFGNRISGTVLLAMVLTYGVLHHSYQQLWTSEELLWSHAVRVNPQASDAWRYLGDLYLGLERMDDSERAFERAVAARPNNAEALTKWGLIKARRGELEAGGELFARALDVAGCYPPALNNLALVERRRGDVLGAIDRYHQSLTCLSNNYRAHLGLGDIYYGEVVDRKQAAEHYSQALELMDPLHPDMPMIKARLLELTW